MISESANSGMTIGIGLIGSGMTIGIDEMGIDVCSFCAIGIDVLSLCNPALRSLSSRDPCNADSSAVEFGWLFGFFEVKALRRSFILSLS